ncbi:MAG: hypothetical protein OXR66_04335 [Candidatus Woesearchaeota archaeon]|nr:hypothetical protein [Candidatus Woesearchaeota archaeon]
MKRATKQYIERYGLVYAFSLALFVTLFPLILRAYAGTPIIPGGTSYTLLNSASILTPLLNVMGNFSWILSAVLALVFLFLLTQYLRRFYRKSIVIFALFAVIVSPTFSMLSTTVNDIIPAMIFLVAGLLYSRFHIVFVTLALFTNPVLGLLGAGHALLLYRKKPIYVIGLLLACAVALWPSLPTISFTPALYELGSNGVSIFFLIFGVHGFMSKQLKNKRTISLLTLCSLALSLFLPDLTLLAILFLAVLIGHSMLNLLTSKWELELLQQTLIVIIFCLALFLAVSSSKELMVDQPTKGMHNALLSLKEQLQEGNVLTIDAYAPLVEYFSDRTAVSSEHIFYSRNPSEVYAFLERTNTRYILLTDEMKDEFFERSDEGILFVLPNTQRFIRAYSADGYEFWYYIPRE